MGNTYGDPYFDSLMLGSGGGGGAGGVSGPGTATAGGNGGAILFLAAQNLSVSGYLNANGQAGSYNNNCGGNGSGGGGGGAGGSLWVAAETLSIAGQYLLANGGAGACNGGGSGGFGRIRIDYGTLNGNTYNSAAVISLISNLQISYPSPTYTGPYPQ